MLQVNRKTILNNIWRERNGSQEKKTVIACSPMERSKWQKSNREIPIIIQKHNPIKRTNQWLHLNTYSKFPVHPTPTILPNEDQPTPNLTPIFLIFFPKEFHQINLFDSNSMIEEPPKNH